MTHTNTSIFPDFRIWDIEVLKHIFKALEDSIYHMNKALSRGTIDCDNFLRFVRMFAREQVSTFIWWIQKKEKIVIFTVFFMGQLIVKFCIECFDHTETYQK